MERTVSDLSEMRVASQDMISVVTIAIKPHLVRYLRTFIKGAIYSVFAYFGFTVSFGFIVLGVSLEVYLEEWLDDGIKAGIDYVSQKLK